jgi:hypothetical protein
MKISTIDQGTRIVNKLHYGENLTSVKDLYSRKDMNLAIFNIDCMQVCCVARTSEITHSAICWQCVCLDQWWKFSSLQHFKTSICYHKNYSSASIFGMMREERSLKFKFESWPPIIGRIMKVKRANRLMSIIYEIYKYFSMNRMSFIENSAPDLYLLRIVYHHLSKWRLSGCK